MPQGTGRPVETRLHRHERHSTRLDRSRLLPVAVHSPDTSHGKGLSYQSYGFSPLKSQSRNRTDSVSPVPVQTKNRGEPLGIVKSVSPRKKFMILFCPLRQIEGCHFSDSGNCGVFLSVECKDVSSDTVILHFLFPDVRRVARIRNSEKHHVALCVGIPCSVLPA